jgi:hypothetical protein
LTQHNKPDILRKMTNFTIDSPFPVTVGVDTELPTYRWGHTGIWFQSEYFFEEDGEEEIYIYVDEIDFKAYFGDNTPVEEAGQILVDQLLTEGLPEDIFDVANAEYVEQVRGTY